MRVRMDGAKMVGVVKIEWKITTIRRYRFFLFVPGVHDLILYGEHLFSMFSLCLQQFSIKPTEPFLNRYNWYNVWCERTKGFGLNFPLTRIWRLGWKH